MRSPKCISFKLYIDSENRATFYMLEELFAERIAKMSREITIYDILYSKINFINENFLNNNWLLNKFRKNIFTSILRVYIFLILEIVEKTCGSCA